VACRRRFEGRVGEPPPQSTLEARLDVAHLAQLAPARRSTPALVKPGGTAGCHQVFRRKHSTPESLVNSLDLREVQRAGRIAGEDGTRHLKPGHRLPAAGRDAACAGGENLPALEQRRDRRVMLELLEGLEGRQAWIEIVETDDV